jgi:hypothetical protein
MVKHHTCETELEKTIWAVIRSSHRFIQNCPSDPLLAGVWKIRVKELTRLEGLLQGQTTQPLSEAKLRCIGHKVARLVSDLCISLIRCLVPRRWDAMQYPLAN